MNIRLIIILITITASSASQAAILHVPSDYSTIAGAATAANDGDTIEIAPGNYIEYNLDISTGVLVRGATGNPADVIIDLDSQGYFFKFNSTVFSLKLEAITVLNNAGLTGAITTDSIFAMIDLAISKCRFEDCSTSGQGSVVSFSLLDGNINLVIEDTVFENCSASNYGGAIYASTNGELNYQLDGVTANNCSGCVFYVHGFQTTGNISNSQFTSNTGGVLHSGANAYGGLAVTNSEFTSNTKDGSGAAIQVTNAISCTVDQSRFINNSASESGGAIYFDEGGPITVKNSLLQGNTAGQYGGAISGQSSSINIELTTIKDNHAFHGGAVHGASFSVNTDKVNFDGNTAEMNGGGIYAGCVKTVQTSMLNNSAEYGGAIYLSRTNDFNAIDHGSFTGNEAYASGASIFCGELLILTLNCCEIDLAECAGGPFDDPIPGFSEVVVTSEGCVVSTEKTSWDKLKACYR